MPTAVVALLLSQAAHATPFVVPHLGGPVFVGPVDAHVTAMYWNPAAMGLLQGTHYYLSATGRLDWTQVERATVDTGSGEPAAGGDKSFSPVSLVPLTVDNFAGAIFEISNDATFGLAVYSPFAENLTSDQALAYHASGGLFYTETFSVGLAYRVEPWLIFGVTVNLLFSKLHLQFDRDTALDGCTATPCSQHIETAANAEHYDLDAPLFEFPSIDVSFGLILRLGDWTVGASAANFFNALARNTVSLVGDAHVTTAASATPTPTATLDGKTTINFNLPATVDLGVRRRVFKDLDLVVGARWTHLGTQNKLDLRLYGKALTAATIPDWIVRERGLDDVYWVEAGLELPPAQAFRWGVRARVSTGGVPEELVAIDQLDAPSLDLSAGVEVRLSTRVAVTGGYTLSLLAPRDVSDSAFSPSARIACNAASFDITLPACVAVRDGRGIPTAAGRYLRVGNALTLGLNIDIW